MKNELTLLPLFIVSILAFLMPILASRIRRVRVPVVVLEILVGILIGRSALNLVHPGEYLQFLSMFGFAFLMFLSGYEIDFSLINTGAPLKWRGAVRNLLMNNLVAGGLVFLGTLVFSGAVSVLLHQYGLIKNTFLMTLILSTTSVGVVVPTLKERGLLGEAYGQTLVVAALISDLGTMVLLTGLVLYLTHSGPFSVTTILEVLLVLVLFGAVYLAYRTGMWLGRLRIVRFLFTELAHAVSQLKVRGAIAVMLLFLVLSEWLGAEIILGAFLAGAILSYFAPKSDTFLSMKLDAIGYGFFIPIFFILVGVNFRLDTLVGSWKVFVLVSVLAVTVFVNKLFPAMLMVPRYGWKRAMSAGVLLSSRLSLLIAAAAIGLKLGMISESINIVIAVLTSSVAPVLFNKLHAPIPLGSQKILVVGAGKIGRALARRLQLLRREVILVDPDAGALDKARPLHLPCVQGDGRRASVLRRAGLDANDIVVACTGHDDTNLRVCELARRVFGVEHTVGRDNNPANTAIFLARGVRPMNLVESAAITLENFVLRPGIYDLLADRQGGNALMEIALKNPSLQGKRFDELPVIHHDLVILLIRRESDHFFPDPDFHLRQDDSLLVFGSPAALQKAGLFLGASEAVDPELPDH
jgi:Kef-type K+ transport system membrane component KefB